MMKLRFAALVLPLALCCSVTFAATAAHHNEISFQQALDIIEKAGYKNLHKIELEHNAYEVEAFDAKGKEVEFKIDAMTGAVTAVKEGKHHHVKHHTKHHAKHHAEAAKVEAAKVAEPAKQ